MNEKICRLWMSKVRKSDKMWLFFVLPFSRWRVWLHCFHSSQVSSAFYFSISNPWLQADIVEKICSTNNTEERDVCKKDWSGQMISLMFFPSDIKNKKKSVINVARMRKETTSNDMIWNHCILILGFGFNYFFKMFTWGRWTHFDKHILQMGWYKTTKLVGRYGRFYPFTLNGTFSHPDELAKSGHAANLAGLVGTMPRCNKALATHMVVFF